MTKAELEKRVKELEKQVEELDRIPTEVTKLSEMKVLLDIGDSGRLSQLWRLINLGYLFFDWNWDIKKPTEEMKKDYILSRYETSVAYEKWMEGTMMFACMLADMDPSEPKYAPAKAELKARMDLWRKKQAVHGCGRGYVEEEDE